MIENKKYIQFEKLNEVSEIIHLFTKRPFNFSKITSTEEKIKEEYQEIEYISHNKFPGCRWINYQYERCSFSNFSC